MRKFKAFTLIELLVVIGIMGILMTGIIQLIAPMHSTATNTKVLNEQRNVEESIASYIGENVRYASNLLIVEEGSIIGEDDGHGGITNAVTVNSPENAITAFFKYGPANMDGIIADTTDNRKKVHVIKFDRNSAFNFENNGYYGRLITNKAGMTGLNYAVGTNGLLTNTDKQYVVFGNGYYGNGDYSMSVGLNEDMHALGIQITSEYWYSNAKLHGKSNQTYANPVIFTYQLRNFGVGSSRYIFKCVSHSGVSGDGHTLDASVSGGAIYFVYLDQEGENLPTDPTLAQTPPHYGANTDEITHNGTNATGPAASTSTSGSSSTPGSSGSTGANGRPGSASGNGGNQGQGNGSGSTGNSTQHGGNANTNGTGGNNGNKDKDKDNNGNKKQEETQASQTEQPAQPSNPGGGGSTTSAIGGKEPTKNQYNQYTSTGVVSVNNIGNDKYDVNWAYGNNSGQTYSFVLEKTNGKWTISYSSKGGIDKFVGKGLGGWNPGTYEINSTGENVLKELFGIELT